MSHVNDPPFTADKFHTIDLKYRSAETCRSITNIFCKPSWK